MQLAEQHPRTRAEWAAYYSRVRRRINAPRQMLALTPPVPALPAPKPPQVQLDPPRVQVRHPDYVPQPKRWCPSVAQASGEYTPPGQHKAYNTLQMGVLAAVPRPAPDPAIYELPAALDVAPGTWAPPRVTYRCAQSRYVLDHVMRLVCQRYDVTRDRLIGPQRVQEVVRPRQVAMYLLKHLTNHSTPAIGRIFGNRDHTTVICAVRRVEQLRQRVPELDAMVRQVLGSFGC